VGNLDLLGVNMNQWFGKVSARRPTMAALAAAAVLASGGAAAVEVQHTLGQVSGNTWQASFAILAAPTDLPVGSFTLYFDHALATQLQLVAAPVGWDMLVIQPDAGLAADGMVDGLADPLAELSPGSSLQGLTVNFAWQGAVAPSGFRFTINDPVSFAVLEQGISVPVPEPATWALALGGLLALAIRTRRIGTSNTLAAAPQT